MLEVMRGARVTPPDAATGPSCVFPEKVLKPRELSWIPTSDGYPTRESG